MNIYKKVWIIILAIVVVGAGITSFTNHYINSQILNQSVAGSISDEETELAVVPETSSTVSQIEETAASSTEAAVSDEKVLLFSKGAYYSRLEELDSQIERMRKQDTGATPYSQKTLAQSELKLWESELDAIYNEFLTHLSETDKQTLITEQRDWMKERDASAVEAAQKSSSGSLESIEYTTSLVKSTRERAYELANRYDAHEAEQ